MTHEHVRAIRRDRHVLSPNGQIPVGPQEEPVSGVVAPTLSSAAAQAANGLEAELVGWRAGRPVRTRIEHLSWTRAADVDAVYDLASQSWQADARC